MRGAATFRPLVSTACSLRCRTLVRLVADDDDSSIEPLATSRWLVNVVVVVPATVG